ncbi:hypothetical protein T492DRAFT_838317 [Pavlovales sp. CCMP2436]|nr:hypothetical protein T492DRAFT_838317 [Pavlovales sp. CCMP2436]
MPSVQSAICCVGGLAFCSGTAAYYWDGWPPRFLVAALLYLAGSSLYLCVGLHELWTATPDLPLQANALSTAASICYVIGSIGLLLDRQGVLFVYICGSALIVTAQLLKVRQLAAAESGRADGKACGFALAIMSIELSVATGALYWLTGSLLMVIPKVGGSCAPGSECWQLKARWARDCWLTGSILFTACAFIMIYRPALRAIESNNSTDTASGAKLDVQWTDARVWPTAGAVAPLGSAFCGSNARANPASEIVPIHDGDHQV